MKLAPIAKAMLVGIAAAETNLKWTKWNHTQHTFSYYPVGGVNVALYEMESRHSLSLGNAAETGEEVEPFELFEDFDAGGEWVASGDSAVTWWHIDHMKGEKDAATLSLYNDKIFVKRWLMSIGIDVARPMAIPYVSELVPEEEAACQWEHNHADTPTCATSENKKKEMLVEAILEALPANETDYVVKPSHLHSSLGVWVVSNDSDSGEARVSKNADKMMEPLPGFQRKMIAEQSADIFLAGQRDDTTMAERGAQAGLVVEERFTAYDQDNSTEPALEFKCIVIWGRLYMANWRRGGWRSSLCPGIVHRNGSMVEGSWFDKLPEWVDWSRIVDIAETLGAHKDMFRVDIFAGVPAGSPLLQNKNATVNEQREATRYVVSELSSTSSEPLPDPILEEASRLWVAGYTIGNYKVIPNNEVSYELLDQLTG